MLIRIKIVDGGKAPEYQREGDACCDCYSRLIAPFIIVPNHARVLINLGFCIELPKGYEAVIRPRSGMTKSGIDVAIGTIDENYRGEVKCQIINNSGGDFEIKNLERICQMKIQRAERFEFLEVDELSETQTAGTKVLGVPENERCYHAPGLYPCGKQNAVFQILSAPDRGENERFF